MTFSESFRKFQTEWMPYIINGAALMGALLIGFIWLSVNFFLENERHTAERAAIKNSMNLAGAFDEHLSRSLSEIDRALKLLRSRYTSAPGEFNLVDWLKTAQLFDSEILQVSIADKNGILRLSNLDPVRFTGIDLSDREHFKVHAHSDSDELFISQPVVSRGYRWNSSAPERSRPRSASVDPLVARTIPSVPMTRMWPAEPEFTAL